MIIEALGIPHAASVENPSVSIFDPSVAEALIGGMKTAAGVTVSETTALKSITVMTCIRLISETLAGLPFHVFREKPDGGREKMQSHRIRQLLDGQPNELQSAHVFRAQLEGHLLSWGNAYAEIEYDTGGEAVALWPITPNRCRPELIDGELVYLVQVPQETRVKALAPGQVFHIPWFSFDGIRGYSPIRMAARSIGLGTAMETFAERFFGAGAHVTGFITHPQQLNAESMARIRSQLENAHSGLERSHRLAVLDEGMKFEAAGMPLEEAQLLESRQFTASQIAGFYRLSPDRVNIFEKAASYGSLDASEVRYVKDSIRPECERWEAEIDRQLLLRWGKKPQPYYGRFNLDGVLRGEPKLRAETHAIYRQWGVLNADEIRALEDRDPQPDGQGATYLVPENMRPANLPYPDRRTSGGRRSNDRAEEDEGATLEARAERALSIGLRSVLERWAAREAKSVARAVREAESDAGEAVAAWYLAQDETALGAELLPAFAAWATLFEGTVDLVAYAEQQASGYLQLRASIARGEMEDASPDAMACAMAEATTAAFLSPRLKGAA